jgi:hypothetical protein
VVEWGGFTVIVTLTPHIDFDPVPRVDISLTELVSYDGGTPGSTSGSLDGGSPGGTGLDADGGTPAMVAAELPAGTDRVTFWRESAGRKLKVRGGVNRVFSGEFGMQDLEPAARGIPSTYEVECFQGSVSLGVVAIGSATVGRPGALYESVLQQPLNPNLNVLIEELDVSVPAITRQAPGEVVYTEGNPYPSLIGFGPRRGLEGVEVAFAAPTREFAASVWATLGTVDAPQMPVWLIRSSHPLLPPVFFCEVLSLQEQDVNMFVGGTESRFVATVTEVAPPAPGLIVSPLSYDDLDFAYESYTARDAAYPSYTAQDSDYSLAGAAG